MLKFIGLLVIGGSIVIGYTHGGGTLSTLWQPYEYLIIMGCALGSLMLGYEKKVLIELKHQAIQSFKHRDDASLYKQFLLLTQELLDNTRRQGVKFLDQHIEAPDQSPLFVKYPTVLDEPMLVTFLTDNLRMLSMGKIESYELEGLLDKEIEAVEDTSLEAAHALNKVAEAMPGFGILAAVLGIVITMGSLSEGTETVGIKVAAALIGTFFGIFMCYAVLGPIAAAMEEGVERNINLLRACREVLVAFSSGKTTIMSLDAARRLVPDKYKPTFSVMEQWLDENKAGSN